MVVLSNQVIEFIMGIINVVTFCFLPKKNVVTFWWCDDSHFSIRHVNNKLNVKMLSSF